MDDSQFYALGAKPIKTQRFVFLIVGLSLIASSIFFALLVIAAYYVDKSALSFVSLVSGIVVLSGFPLLAGVVFIILAIVKNVSLRNRDQIIEAGKIANDRLIKRQQEREEREAIKQPDFQPTKVFTSGLAKIWINQETHQIQFYLPVMNGGSSNNLALFFSRKAKMFKTKVLSIDDIDSVDIGRNEKTIEHVSGGTIGASNDYASSRHLSGDITTTTIAYYSLIIKFNDVDHPLVFVYFNNDGITPSTCAQTLNILRRRGNGSLA